MGKIPLLVVVLASLVFAQLNTSNTPVPQEVTDLIHKALSDSEPHFRHDFNNSKLMMGFDSLTKISDIRAGDPIRYCWILKDSLRKANENTPVSALLTSIIGEYEVPLLLKGKVIAFLLIEQDQKKGEKWQVTGECWGGRLAGEWQKVIRQWPISRGFTPVLVEISSIGGKLFFYVPQKGDYNLTSIELGTSKYSNITDSSYSNLTESKNTYKLVQRELGMPYRNKEHKK